MAAADNVREACEKEFPAAKEDFEEIEIIQERVRENETKVSEDDLYELKQGFTGAEEAFNLIEECKKEGFEWTDVIDNVSDENQKIKKIEESVQEIEETKRLFYKILNSICVKYKKIAHQCCSNPSNCVFQEISNETPGLDLNVIASTISALSQGIASAGDKSQISRMCKVMRTVSLTTSGVNATLSAFCFVKINTCVNACYTEHEDVENLSVSDPSTYHIKKLEQNTFSCKSLRVAGGLMVAQSAILAGLTAFFQHCANTAKENQVPTAMMNGELRGRLEDYWRETCSSDVGHSSCAKCLKNNRLNLNEFECTNPKNFRYNNRKMSQSPNDLSRNKDGQDGNKRFSTFGADDDLYSGNDVVDPTSSEMKQGFQSVPTAQSSSFSSQSPSARGGGGSLGTGGGGSSSKQANNKRRRSSKDKKHNTDILEGFRSGGGGSLVEVPTSNFKGGGSSDDYSSRRKRSRRREKESFNLKDFLPGGKKDLKQKKEEKAYFPSINENPLQVGHKKESLFLLHSKKIYKLCETGKLKNCNF